MYERFLHEPIPATIGRGKRLKRRLKKIYLRLPMRPLVRFLYAYVFRLGFLDGKPGLVFCTLLSFYDFLAWAKVYEQRIARRSETAASVPEAAARSRPIDVRLCSTDGTNQCRSCCDCPGRGAGGRRGGHEIAPQRDGVELVGADGGDLRWSGARWPPCPGTRPSAAARPTSGRLPRSGCSAGRSRRGSSPGPLGDRVVLAGSHRDPSGRTSSPSPPPPRRRPRWLYPPLYWRDLARHLVLQVAALGEVVVALRDLVELAGADGGYHGGGDLHPGDTGTEIQCR